MLRTGISKTSNKPFLPERLRSMLDGGGIVARNYYEILTIETTGKAFVDPISRKYAYLSVDSRKTCF